VSSELYCSLHWIRVLSMLDKHNFSLNGHLHLSRLMLLNALANVSRLVSHLYCRLYINSEAPSVV
jgi:hypothetical protein